MTEIELCKFVDKNIKVICTDGPSVQGFCSIFTQALDNEPEIASICIENSEGELIEVYLNEIKSIEVI